MEREIQTGELGEKEPISSGIYSEIECQYLGNTLKKKMDRKDELDDEYIDDIIEKGLRTLQALMSLLLIGSLFGKIRKHFKHDVTVEDVIRLLIRCKKMYEAKSVIENILKCIIKKE